MTGSPTCCRTSRRCSSAHFAVPLAGAVLVAINTRLSTEEVRYILDHSAATVLVVDAVPPCTRRSARSPTSWPRSARSSPSSTLRRPATASAPDQLRRPARPRLGRPAALGRRRRARHHHDQLHLGDDRQPEGRPSTTTAVPT
ncbi:AMP-binding protein [Pseudonocardia sp. ICBG601]|uniref:AMP-binding protein n=1 Tax=Pseudonocardia sp. ICBG601 TaxID=2846759 RepID=UPI0027E29259|nr:AMP-binding protein [Pseudonocardia sp. ICBG601]